VTPEVAASLRAVLEDPSSVDVAGLDQLFSDCKTTSVFMGTTVQHGHGKGLVVATGMNTEFGKTFQEMKNVEQRKTPLQVFFFFRNIFCSRFISLKSYFIHISFKMCIHLSFFLSFFVCQTIRYFSDESPK
jgi:magnesium-transporting ATPase (P-type)